MSLSVTYSSLRSDVGRFLGYGRDPDDWTTDQVDDVEECLKVGLRQFYWPVSEGGRYTWSFLRPLNVLVTESGTSTYDLPDDFGGMLGDGFSFPDGSRELPIGMCNEHEIRRRLAADDTTSVPKYAAIRVKTQNPGQAERYEVVFSPIPDATYTLSYRYSIQPGALDYSNDTPLGGEQHAETIRESCLSAAEAILDDTEGVHTQRFARQLATSIGIDRELSM